MKLPYAGVPRTAHGTRRRYTSTPSPLGFPLFPVQEPVHTAGALAHSVTTVFGAFWAEQVAPLPLQPKGAVVMLPFPTM